MVLAASVNLGDFLLAVVGRPSHSRQEYSIKRCLGSFDLLPKSVHIGDYMLIAFVRIYHCLNGSELITDSLGDRCDIGSLIVGEVRLTQSGVDTANQTRHRVCPRHQLARDTEPSPRVLIHH
jgi:hypothetical protein